ncbi:MAG TPA: gamma carbonic anhydrase family protein [Candidatus Sulfotelmatobacter sp.]|nr:gamma carbonic anhydrase family protein [Candidatus Sulfotelmatobacter sp.]
MDQLPAPAGSVLPYRGVWPTLAADVFLAPNCFVIGQVTIAERANLWFNVVVRGDDHWVRIGARTNIQDGAIIHVFKDTNPTTIGADVTIGHGAILHGCTIEDGAMVGIGAIVLDGAVVESEAIVAAGAVLSPGKRVRRGELWAGCPARLVRAVKPDELAFMRINAPNYCELASEYLALRRGLGAAARAGVAPSA